MILRISGSEGHVLELLAAVIEVYLSCFNLCEFILYTLLYTFPGINSSSCAQGLQQNQFKHVKMITIACGQSILSNSQNYFGYVEKQGYKSCTNFHTTENIMR